MRHPAAPAVHQQLGFVDVPLSPPAAKLPAESGEVKANDKVNEVGGGARQGQVSSVRLDWSRLLGEVTFLQSPSPDPLLFKQQHAAACQVFAFSIASWPVIRLIGRRPDLTRPDLTRWQHSDGDASGKLSKQSLFSALEAAAKSGGSALIDSDQDFDSIWLAVAGDGSVVPTLADAGKFPLHPKSFPLLHLFGSLSIVPSDFSGHIIVCS